MSDSGSILNTSISQLGKLYRLLVFQSIPIVEIKRTKKLKKVPPKLKKRKLKLKIKLKIKLHRNRIYLNHFLIVDMAFPHFFYIMKIKIKGQKMNWILVLVWNKLMVARIYLPQFYEGDILKVWTGMGQATMIVASYRKFTPKLDSYRKFKIWF